MLDKKADWVDLAACGEVRGRTCAASLDGACTVQKTSRMRLVWKGRMRPFLGTAHAQSRRAAHVPPGTTHYSSISSSSRVTVFQLRPVATTLSRRSQKALLSRVARTPSGYHT